VVAAAAGVADDAAATGVPLELLPHPANTTDKDAAIATDDQIVESDNLDISQ
jgi:hypothetical protein